ncbi:uncharacterized protein LOC129949295 [Eupeodes corollae]|uniref:uncharacterized protein LOC129949295 n=1 Tax=Eupeodes corollae TaxID=290404 RepID=UPI0024932141|nr:uncharacterized protein LOC129949295 [Eupeodes corollae]
MAYINVAEWTPDQVTDWLKGLDDSMYNYVYSFTNNEVGGQQLLNIRPYELEQLGMVSIGHQEIVLEAVENLRNFHYNLDKENLQFLALHMATAARNLYRQLATHCDNSKIETQILNDITRTIATIKPIISWLDRAPFHGHLQFNEIRKNMLKLGLEMATSAQRDRFVENPAEQIKTTAETLAKLGDYIIQDITDPMLLQPASLSLVTLKKRESELGFNIEPSYHGIHKVIEIKYNSPAHNSGKIEDGDEIVQINYQTVVGWQYKTVIMQLRESLPDVLLTLKKRPKHTKIYGQIYMQPYRLPSKKRAMGTRWGENLPSPRAGFLAVPEFNLPLKISEKTDPSDTDSSCSDILTPTDSKSVEKEIRLYYPKPRAVLQRRNTICGDELYSLKNVSGAPLWHERKNGAQNGDPSSPSLRDKSVSFGFGLEIAPRPTTCLGIANGKLIGSFSQELKLGVSGGDSKKCGSEEKSKPGVSKVVRFDANMKYEDYPVDQKYTCNVENTILETFEPIPFVDEEDASPTVSVVEVAPSDVSPSGSKEELTPTPTPAPTPTPTTLPPLLMKEPLIQAINHVTIARRGRLDKSHSTPAYDNSGEESDTPPAIEPRKEFILTTPPAPPPRPKKPNEAAPLVVPPPPPKPASLMPPEKVPPKPVVESVVVIPPSPIAEESELHTPTKTKTLTLKKKNSLIAKRRKISLKILGTGDIQGHLYRRTKDKRGVTFWAKLYFVLMDTNLYGFRTKESAKANCFVYLPGFTVSLAKEVHSKPYAFKVYHPSKTFYFAAESLEALNQWMDFIRQATLQQQKVGMQSNDSDVPSKELFSETESSGDESDSLSKSLCTPSPSSGSKDFVGSKNFQHQTPTTSVKHDKKYLGSLRKFTKSSLPFKSSSSSGDKKPSSDIPVPTEQYRSYRKVPGGSFGIQIGANTPGYTDPNNLHPFQNNPSPEHNSVSAQPTQPPSLPTKTNLSASRSSVSESSVRPSVASSSSAALERESRHMDQESPPSLISKSYSIESGSKMVKKTFPYNYIHASNPNLVEFDFQTSKTLDYSLPKINPGNSWDAPHNLQVFLTLKDLMLQKQKEEAQEMYNNRVLLGVEKQDDRNGKIAHLKGGKPGGGDNQQPGETGKLSKIQSRSLPKTPDYEMSFKPDDEDIKRTRTKEGLKLRDFGYELISGDEPICDNRANRTPSDLMRLQELRLQKLQQMQNAAVKAKKQHSSTSESDKSTSHRGGSFKKTKGKLEAFKTSSERLFQFKHSSNEPKGLTTSMTLPLNKKSSHMYNSQGKVDQGGSPSSCGSGGGIKKSHTYNNEFKDKKYEAPRKNSAPMPILSKLSFTSSKTAKERKLLGSPRLHRAIFGGRNAMGSNNSSQDYEHEIFSPVEFSNKPYPGPSTSVDHAVAAAAPLPPLILPDKPTPSSSAVLVSPEYPNMECPPVFEPETYSLSDPNASLTLLRRRNNAEEP